MNSLKLFLTIIIYMIVIVTIVQTAHPRGEFFCYECNVHVEYNCNDVNSVQIRKWYLKKCDKDFCSNALGQLGDISVNYSYKYDLQRGCGELPICTDPQANCCTCNTTGCNFEPDCGKSADLQLNQFLFYVLVLIGIFYFNMN